MIPAEFRYVRPATLTDALGILRDEPGARPLAGGQSLLTLLKTRVARPAVVVDLGALAELRELRRDDDTVTVGAMVTMATLARETAVRESASILPRTLAHVADVQVRNRGTLGGSLAYGDPAGDLAGAAIAAGASVRLVSADGERVVPVAELYAGPFTTVLEPGELVAEIAVPRHDGARTAYHAIARRPADPTLAGVAVVARFDGDTVTDVRLGLVGLADRPLEAVATAGALRGNPLTPDTVAAAVAALDGEIAPVDSTAGSATYRRAVAPAALERALRDAEMDREMARA